MHNAQAPLTPPPTPPQHDQYRCPSTPESRIGKILGESLQLKGILGTGAYGVVYSALDLYTHTWYAVKALSKTNGNGQSLDHRQREFQQREIQLHYAASAHPNIVSMLKIVDDPECTYVILEYCPEGDLFSNITEKCRYVGNDTRVQRAFLQILDAVEHCHRLGIYHRDLKPENILVSNSGSDVLLADFGLATTDATSEDHGCGSTFYMSPECLDQSSRRLSYRCAPNDIWSLGVILVNLTCGRNPWKQASVVDPTYKAFTKNRNFLKTILPLSDELNDILGLIFESNPEARITIGDLKQRIWNCSSFSARQQQLATPPQSPRNYANNVSYDSLSVETLSDDGSTFSDECSMTSSVSTISDEADSEAEDSGYESQEECDVTDCDPVCSPEASQEECFQPVAQCEPAKGPEPVFFQSQVPSQHIPQFAPQQPHSQQHAQQPQGYRASPYCMPVRTVPQWYQTYGWGQLQCDRSHALRNAYPAGFYPTSNITPYPQWQHC